MIYQFNKNARHPASADPTETALALEDIKSRHGALTATSVADDVEAEPENHPLREWFTWDPELAMRKCHIEEAGDVLRAVVVTDWVPDQSEPVRAYVVTRGDDGQKEYWPIQTVVTDRDRALRLIEECRDDAQRAQRKLDEMLDLLKLVLQT